MDDKKQYSKIKAKCEGCEGCNGCMRDQFRLEVIKMFLTPKVIFSIILFISTVVKIIGGN